MSEYLDYMYMKRVFNEKRKPVPLDGKQNPEAGAQPQPINVAQPDGKKKKVKLGKPTIKR